MKISDEQLVAAVDAFVEELKAWTIEQVGTEQWMAHDFRRQIDIMAPVKDGMVEDCVRQREFFGSKEEAIFQTRCQAMRKAFEAVK